MKKIASVTALIVALAIPGLALASAPKVGDKVNLCEKQGVYTLVQGKDKCDGVKAGGHLSAIKDGKMEVDVKGKKIAVDAPKAGETKAALKNEPAKTTTKPESRIVAMSFCEPRSWTRVLSS